MTLWETEIINIAQEYSYNVVFESVQRKWVLCDFFLPHHMLFFKSIHFESQYVLPVSMGINIILLHYMAMGVGAHIFNIYSKKGKCITEIFIAYPDFFQLIWWHFPIFWIYYHWVIAYFNVFTVVLWSSWDNTTHCQFPNVQIYFMFLLLQLSHFIWHTAAEWPTVCSVKNITI